MKKVLKSFMLLVVVFASNEHKLYRTDVRRRICVR